MNAVTIDRDRGAVYLAEDQFHRVQASRGRAVRLGRSVVVLPAGLTFGDLEAVAGFLAAAGQVPQTRARYPQAGPVAVVARRGFRRAQYVARPPGGGPPEIQLPAVDRRGSWALAQTVVLHEFAHHLAAAVPGHGRQFRAALEHLYAVHLGPDAASVLSMLLAPLDDLPPVADRAADDPAARRVSALLAKASATDSADEAAALLAKANTLATRHSIDLAVAAIAEPGVASQPTHRMVTIGRPGESLNKILVTLFARLAHSLGVTVDVGPRSAYVLAYGLAGDLDALEAMYVTASAVMVAGADGHARSGEWRGQQYRAVDGRGQVQTRPVNGRVARNAFCIGFIERVVPAGSGPAASAATSPQARTDQVAIALRHKEVVVADYHRGATRARGAWRGSASAAGSATSSRAAGRQAGERFGRSRLASGSRPELSA